MQFGILNSKLGNTVITAAVVNDIMSLIILSIILQLAADGGTGQLNDGDIIVSGINIAVFLGAYFYSTSYSEKLQADFEEKLSHFLRSCRQRGAAFGVLQIATIAISLIAQDIGLHFVIDIFFSGLVIH
jgi:Kef-type K+ transport system membrane component KefB